MQRFEVQHQPPAEQRKWKNSSLREKYILVRNLLFLGIITINSVRFFYEFTYKHLDTAVPKGTVSAVYSSLSWPSFEHPPEEILIASDSETVPAHFKDILDQLREQNPEYAWVIDSHVRDPISRNYLSKKEDAVSQSETWTLYGWFDVKATPENYTDLDYIQTWIDTEGNLIYHYKTYQNNQIGHIDVNAFISRPKNGQAKTAGFEVVVISPDKIIKERLWFELEIPAGAESYIPVIMFQPGDVIGLGTQFKTHWLQDYEQVGSDGYEHSTTQHFVKPVPQEVRSILNTQASLASVEFD